MHYIFIVIFYLKHLIENSIECRIFKVLILSFRKCKYLILKVRKNIELNEYIHYGVNQSYEAGRVLIRSISIRLSANYNATNMRHSTVLPHKYLTHIGLCSTVEHSSIRLVSRITLEGSIHSLSIAIMTC